MRSLSVDVDIAAPPAHVWEVMSDTARWAEWTPSVTSIRRLDSGPFAVGSRVLIRQPRLPPALWKVVALEPGTSFTWTSVAPGLRVTAHHRVRASGEGSRATLSLEYRGPLGGLLARLTRGITEKYVAFEATGLKARCEDPAFRHSGMQPG